MDEEPGACPTCGAPGNSCRPSAVGGVFVTTLEDMKGIRMFTLSERTYVNADKSRIVAESSPDAAYLLGVAGTQIADQLADQLGLTKPKPKKGRTAQVAAPEATADRKAP